MSTLGLRAGHLVWLTSEREKRIPARLKEQIPADEGAGGIGLDRFLRQALKVQVGQGVEVELLSDPKPVQQVLLAPAIDVSMAHQLPEHLRRTLALNQTPVAEGSVLYATFEHSTGGTTYRVVTLKPGPGIVTEDTEIEVRYEEEHAPELDVTYEDVGGLSREIRLVRELVDLPLTQPHIYRQVGISPPRGIILYGPPGAGKTLLLKAIAGEVSVRLYYVNGPDIIGTYYGEAEANLRRIFNEGAHHSPSIIFFDEIDAITPRRGTAGTMADTRLVSQLLSLLDGLAHVDGVLAIATTNRVDSIDPALRRPGRFDREIYIGPPDSEGRLEILRIHTREMPLDREAEEFLPEVAARTHGFVGADLLELCREAGLSALRRQGSALSDPGVRRPRRLPHLRVDRQDFEEAMERVRPSALREALLQVPTVRWEDVGGLRYVKRRLEELVMHPLRHADQYRLAAVASPSGILLYGAPGSGKTHLARALAAEAGVNFIAIDGPEIFSQWLGESEEAVRHVFKLARQLAPTLLFIDQLDAVAPRRGSDVSSRTSERVVNQLLAEIDGIEGLSQIVVIGATNRIDLLDPALLRPGRLGVRLELTPPDLGEREEILHVLLKPHAFENKEQTVARIAQETEGLVGADLAGLVQDARYGAIRAAPDGQRAGFQLTATHLLEALQRVLRRPPTSPPVA